MQRFNDVGYLGIIQRIDNSNESSTCAPLMQLRMQLLTQPGSGEPALAPGGRNSLEALPACAPSGSMKAPVSMVAATEAPASLGLPGVATVPRWMKCSPSRCGCVELRVKRQEWVRNGRCPDLAVCVRGNVDVRAADSGPAGDDVVYYYIRWRLKLEGEPVRDHPRHKLNIVIVPRTLLGRPREAPA